jgi:hypothetical protein
MIPRLLSAAPMAAAAAVTAVACPAQPRTGAGAIAAENAWVKALEDRDSFTLGCILDASFSDNDWRGQRISRADVLAHLPQRQPSTLRLSELEPTVEGSMAVVRGLNTQTAADGSVIGTVRFTDVFIYRGHRWRAVAAQETLVR